MAWLDLPPLGTAIERSVSAEPAGLREVQLLHADGRRAERSRERAWLTPARPHGRLAVVPPTGTSIP
jgi:hypothetical protein